MHPKDVNKERLEKEESEKERWSTYKRMKRRKKKTQKSLCVTQRHKETEEIMKY